MQFIKLQHWYKKLFVRTELLLQRYKITSIRIENINLFLEH